MGQCTRQSRSGARVWDGSATVRRQEIVGIRDETAHCTGCTFQGTPSVYRPTGVEDRRDRGGPSPDRRRGGGHGREPYYRQRQRGHRRHQPRSGRQRAQPGDCPSARRRRDSVRHAERRDLRGRVGRVGEWYGRPRVGYARHLSRGGLFTSRGQHPADSGGRPAMRSCVWAERGGSYTRHPRRV